MHARHFYPEILSRTLSRPLNRGPGRIEEIRDARDSSAMGRNLLMQRQPLAALFRLQCTEPGNIAARACQILNETATDRIGNNNEYDRDGARRSLHRRCRGRAKSQDHIWCLGYKLRSEGSRAVGLANVPEIVNLNVATLRPS